MSDNFTLKRGTAIAGAGAVLATALTQPVFAQAGALAALVREAKAEGGVTVDGPPIDDVRDAMVAGFQKEYGIPVSYISSGTSRSGARVRAERAAGKYLLDVFMSGADTPTLTFLPGGWLDRVEPILVAPDVIDKSKWKDGKLTYEDDAHTILRVQQNIVPELAINTRLVKKNEVTTWKSLLDPKWKGRMVAKDPAASGAGQSLASYFYLHFGPEFVKKLYVEQKPTLTVDARQGMQWLAQGNNPILIGPDTPALVQFQNLGYPVEPIFPTDAPSVLTGSWGLICLMNRAPHPKAAQLFINWIAGPKPQLAYAKATQSLSLRNDLKYEGFPSYIFPQKGAKYIDTYAYKFITEQRDPALTKVRELLGE